MGDRTQRMKGKANEVAGRTESTGREREEPAAEDRKD